MANGPLLASTGAQTNGPLAASTGASSDETWDYGTNASGNGGGSGSGSGSSGSGGSGDGTLDITDRERKAADNLGGIVGWNADTVRGAYDNANKVYDVADEQSKNLQAVQTKQNKKTAANDWYAQQQKLQSVVANLSDNMGNSANGSSIYDFWDMIARKDDMDDASTLDTMRKNQNTIDNAYYEAIMQNNNSRNDQAMQTEKNLREIAGDYAAQMNNISPGMVDENGLIDAENHTLNLPDWLNTSFFDEHLREAVKPEDQGLYRPDAAASDNWAQYLLTGQRNTASSSSPGYRDRLVQGYQRRTQ